MPTDEKLLELDEITDAVSANYIYVVKAGAGKKSTLGNILDALGLGTGDSPTFAGINLPSGSGSETPTAVANVDATTSASMNYLRVDDFVFFTGSVNIDPTASATFTAVRITIPVASNFTSSSQAGGSCGRASDATEIGLVVADTANDEIILRFISSTTGNHAVAFSGSYLVV